MLKIYTLLSNQSLLARYTSGEGLRISHDDLLNATYVQAWQRYDSLPDHRLKNSLQCVYGDKNTYWGYLRGTFENLTDSHLEFKGQTLCAAKEETFGSWQDVIVEHSPLDLMAFVMSKKAMNESDIRQLIQANITHCPLPGFSAPLLDSCLDDLLQCDLHVHLNGSTFADAIWESALRNPLEFRAQMMKEWKGNKETVEELFAQFSPHFGWRESATLIDIAANLRDWLARRLVTPQLCYNANGCSMREQCNMRDFFTISCKSEVGECCKCATYALRKRLWLERPLQNFVLYAPPIGSYRAEHPLCTHAPSNVLSFSHEFSPLQFETYFYVLIFRKLQSESDEYFARCFHYYILLKNFFRKLLVQQCSQVGFDQFQKITLTGIREYHERAYFDRLRQFEASAGHTRIHVEGRFAPKDTLQKLAFIKHKINEGYGEYVRDCRVRLKNKKCVTMAKLSLVAHFIKTKDDSSVPGCQYYNYRRRLIRQARTLVRYIDAERNGHFSVPIKNCSPPPITGFDAAANELDAPPEVFAPLYRFLRSHGHTHFTFHAGEDFQHLVSGIRAVDEAVDFLQLSAGNRIGHATALGIDPKLWRIRNEEGVRILKSEWLDTLVYALFALRESADFSKDVSRAAAEIPQICSNVYGKVYSEDCLYRAWQLRHLDPLVAFFDYDTGMTDAFTENELQNVRAAVSTDSEAYDLFEKYHILPAVGCKKLARALENSRKFRPTPDSRYEKYGVMPSSRIAKSENSSIKDAYVKVENSFFTDEALTFLQARVLEKLYQKSIAIESLITSNVRISFYKNYDEHHILRWLGLDEGFKGEVYPPICLGTDDPGIFETSVKNECLHLLTMLKKQGLPEHECVEIIERLLKNSESYLFKN